MEAEGRVFRWGLVIAAIAQALIAVAYVTGTASGTSSAWQGLPLDDGWIHLVYARNILQGFEIAYNPGEPEVGLTSPLWALLLAPTSTLPGHGPAIAAKLLGIVTALACTALAGALGRKLAGPVAGVVAATLVALDPTFAFSAVSGMEVGLAAALCLGGLLAVAHRRLLSAAAVLGLAWLARPETAMVTIVAALWVVERCRAGDMSWKRAVLAGAIALAPALAFGALCLSVTGRPLQNTFYVKGTLDLLPAAGLWVLARGVLAESTVLSYGVGAIALLGALQATWKRGDLDRLAVIVAPIAFALGVAASRSFSVEETHTYFFTRYFHPALPMLAVGVGLGAGDLYRWAASAKKKQIALRQSRLRLAAVAGLGALSVVLVVNLPALRARYSWNTRNIEEMQVAAARWIARSTPEDAVVAASDAGAVRFFGRRRVIDVMGLNAHQLIDARRAGRIPLGQVMREERPTHLAVLEAWFPNITRGGRARPVFVAHADHYTIASAATDTFVVYEVLRR